jgi:hypothetical protein
MSRAAQPRGGFGAGGGRRARLVRSISNRIEIVVHGRIPLFGEVGSSTITDAISIIALERRAGFMTLLDAQGNRMNADFRPHGIRS